MGSSPKRADDLSSYRGNLVDHFLLILCLSPPLPQHPEARPQAPECGLHFQASCFMPLAPGFQPHASNHPLGFSISSIHRSPSTSTPRTQTPSSRVWPSYPALMFHTSSPGFQPHTSNYEPSRFLDPLWGLQLINGIHLQAPVSRLCIQDPALPGQPSSSRLLNNSRPPYLQSPI